jgi:uncharacterized protein YybS (DUF2232 family)
MEADTTKEIALGMAITCLLFGISVYLPIIGFFGSVLIPIPVLFFRVKLGRRPGFIMTGGIIVVMLAVLGRVSFDTVFFIELLILGFFLAELMLAGLSVEKTLLYTCAAVCMTGFLGLLIFASVSGTTLTDMITGYVSQNLKLTLKLYEHMEVGEETLYAISRSLEQIEYVLVRILPGLAVASTLFICWSSMLLARSALKTKGLFYPDFGRLNQWKAPEQLVWVAIVSGLLLLLPVKPIKLFGINTLIVLMTIYFFAGIAIVSFFFEKKTVPRVIRFFLYALIAFQQIILLVVIALGFFDIWLNFRKLNSNENGKLS